MPSSKLAISDVPGGVAVAMPAPRNWIHIIVLPLWLGMWIFTIINVTRTLQPVVTIRMGWFPLIWLTIWILGGLAAVYSFLWGFWGREILTIKNDRLTLRGEVFGVGWSQNVNLNQVRQFGCRPVFYTMWSFHERPSQRGAMAGRIAFESGTKTYGFGAGLSVTEAADLAAEIQRRFPMKSA